MLIIFTCTTFAAQVQSTVGVVIIGGAEFKTKDYYKMIQSEIKSKNGAKFQIGNEIQSKYQRYLFENDLVGETTPRKQNLIDFTVRSSCDKVLFLVVSSTADHQNNPKSRQKDRLTVQVDAYLCDKFSVREVLSSVQENHSKTSDLRARRGAFRKCLEELAKGLTSL